MSKTLSLTASLVAVVLVVISFATNVTAKGALDGGNAPASQRYATGHPKNPETWYLLAEWLSEQAKDTALSPDSAKRLVLRGLDVNEQALTMNPVYYEALTLKAVLLRQRAAYEKDLAVQKTLIAEADVYRAKAEELAKRQRGER